MSLRLSSPAFRHGDPIPDRYVVREDAPSPPLQWAGVPPDTHSLLLVCHDPDAPRLRGWTHWVLNEIPSEVTGLEEGTTAHTQHQNSAGSLGYSSPAPPPGHGVHHYYFHLLALNSPLDLDSSTDWPALQLALDGHVAAQARLVGTYER